MKTQEIYNHITSHLQSGACTSMGGGEILMVCPGCGDEMHFSVNVRKGVFNCFKCEIGGNIRYEIQRNRQEWLSLTSRLPSDTPSGYTGKARPICSLGGQAISVVVQDIPPDKTPLEYTAAVRAMKYCYKRGMTKEQIEEYKVCIKALDPRVWFPYWNEKGEVIFQMGRTMVDTVEPKTQNHPEGSELPLFGRHVHVERDEVVLVEGVFDHFVTPSSYALMGSNITGPQIIQLREDDIKRVFLVLDPDASQQAVSAAQKLANFRFDVFPVVIQNKKDPAELGRKWMDTVIKEVKRNHPIRPQTIYFYL